MVETANNLSAPEEEDDEFNEDLDPDPRTLEENRCPVCGVINPNKTLIECTHCCKRYHITCVNNRKSQLKQFTRCSCRSCRNVSNPNHDTPNTDNQTIPEFDILQYLRTCKSNVSLLGNIPRGARIAAAEAFNELNIDVIQTNSPLSWSKLLCFTHHGLQKPKKEKPTSASPSLVTKIKHQVSTLRSFNFPPSKKQR